MTMKIRLALLAITAALSTASVTAHAASIDVSITNATKGIYFTPLLVVAHSSDIHLFQAGVAASPEIKAMAEGGDISGLSSLAANAGAVVSENPASGILNPGVSATASLDTGSFHRLSLTAMLLPTNDGFVGLDSWQIPSQPGTYTIRLNGYDAGTEANDELAASMPNPPFITFGSGGTGVEATISNDKVHIHPGNLGDGDTTGGKSDLNSGMHRWLNPVAVVTVTVK
ncbi:spondin domain-containing protein [Photobacterium sanguinicancri]|uniref:Spondin domain-containing protein n=1 Tax=Photobacterium sanguinicancri TaxID=875932 RepID=A0AAW7XYL5_9GAMM|nr:spondin domain-containing protein [Photobacterium sanguinicancri]MDO6541401.1 spondin domain-containing protein [Photobacterium sanguinicancri]